MKTEELKLSPLSHDVRGLSRALHHLAPLSCRIVDPHGKPISLSSAGYVLRYGKAYHVQVVSPFPDGELKDVSIINAPHFIVSSNAFSEADDRGRQVYSLPFTVSRPAWGSLSKFGMDVQFDELEIIHYLNPELHRESVKHQCPVVVRPKWLGIVMAIVVSLVALLLERMIHILLELDVSPSRWASELVRSLKSRPDLWIGVGALVGLIWLVINVYHLVRIGLRGRALRKHYREHYETTTRK